MKAIDRPFTKVINGTTQFVIPVFQRDYSWSDDQCAQLWNDIVRAGAPNGRPHFMGSFVYIAAGDSTAGFTRWLLIDGQQRMTTVTLLLVALRSYLDSTGWKPLGEDDPTVKKVTNYFLRNNDEDGDRQYKLVLRRHDQDALRALLDGQVPPKNGGSRVLETYEFFQERLAVGDVDPRVLYAGLGRLMVVDVTLDRATDDPQMIFESLNSTGQDLSQADLIRNFILMRVSEAEQTRLYDHYWQKIDELFRGASRTFDSFARDYLALRTRATKQARAEDIYYEFRHFFREREALLGLEDALKDILKFARYYAAFTLGRDVLPSLKAPLERLCRQAEVSAVLVMQLFDLGSKGKTLSQEDFAEALDLLESYVFRRSVCALQSRGYWQIFAPIAYKMGDAGSLETLKGLLARQRDSYRFPKDQEFKEALRARDVYNMRGAHSLLDRLENHDTKEPTDTTSYTVEHILPQNESVPKAWREMLGADWQQLHQTHVNRLGNLTLTAYNSTYSDRPFDEKKKIKGGFNDSAVRLNKSVRDAEKWNAAAIESRGEALAQTALQIWGPLAVSEATLKAAAQDDLKARAAKRSLSNIAMTKEAQDLFAVMRPAILSVSPGIIEVPEAASISYHAAGGDFFLEILPRKHRLQVLLNIDRRDCCHQDDDLIDAADRKFFVNAANAAPTAYKFREPAQLDGLVKIARQAHELAGQ